MQQRCLIVKVCMYRSSVCKSNVFNVTMCGQLILLRTIPVLLQWYESYSLQPFVHVGQRGQL